MNFINNEPFELPLVITRGFVAFPKQASQLSVQRLFSVNAVRDSKENFESYCILVSQKDLEVDYINDYNDIYSVGTLIRITELSKSKNENRVRFIAEKRIKINSIRIENNEYYANAVLLEDVYGDPNEEMSIIRNIIGMIENNRIDVFFSGSGTYNQDLRENLGRGMNPLDLSNSLASRLNVPTEKKQEMLEASTINERLMKILLNMKDLAELQEIDKKIMKTVQDSAEKQQKDYYLREKMRAIKKELGEDSSQDEQTIQDKLNKYPYPEDVKVKVRDELHRKEMMPQGSLEASLIQDYIDSVLAVPWFEQTNDNDDINHAKEILDEDHYGLEKPKQRIIEYLAVKKVKGNLKAPIICFYGPPGCGKTSLSRSIARALDRKFIKCSLGGVYDESEIRGHRRTYVGSRPGRIINSLKKVGVTNPVFLLDEIDKLGHDSFKGDPSSALLEVLDPEQNVEFNDNYLELSYDLSNVLFVCTANNIENIPGPLLDRLELIPVPSYTSIDKLHIAKGYLIPKEMENNGIAKENIEFTDDAIYYVIDRYTRESGVRSLQRALASILRKVIVENLSTNNKEKVIITPKEVVKYLGAEIFESTKKEKGEQVGVVTGLAYTDYGGEILPIEVNYFPGKGGLVLTGKLGEVMKESCQIALDYVKSNAKKYEIDSTIFEKNDIHVHVPEGAIPKDGPSAGVAITIAIISALSKKPVSGNIAMTGEVTLRGNALPIGGLREKSLAAMRSGVKKIIIPEGNKRNANELPKEIKDHLKIIYMKNVDDAYKEIFN